MELVDGFKNLLLKALAPVEVRFLFRYLAQEVPNQCRYGSIGFGGPDASTAVYLLIDRNGNIFMVLRYHKIHAESGVVPK